MTLSEGESAEAAGVEVTVESIEDDDVTLTAVPG